MIHTLQLNQPIFCGRLQLWPLYQGKPAVGADRQAGKFAELCAQLDHGDGGG